MHKSQFLAKLNKVDYNNTLEEVLENKSFTADTKNILLSMLYKIEISYNDYAKVKRNVMSKNKFIEEIIIAIRDYCKTIKLVEPNSETGKQLAETGKIADTNTEEIISLPTEYALLTVITEKMDLHFNSNNILEKEIQKILRSGYMYNAKEVIYNFDGWTWNTGNMQDNDLIYSLLYQNILTILGYEFIENWRKDLGEKDYIKLAKEKIFNIYNGENQILIVRELTKVIAKGFIENFPEETNKYIEELKELKYRFKEFDDTNKYLSQISKQKKELNSKIKSVDKILLDKDLLKKEYEKENESRPLEKKIFSIRHYGELLKKEKQELLNKINEWNNMIQPSVYLEKKEELRTKIEKFEIIENATLEKKTFNQLVLDFQDVFLKLLTTKVEKANTKKELIDLIYILRYYKNIKVEKKQYIKDIPSIKRSIDIFERTLLLKAYNSEVFNKLTENPLYNVDILSNILSTQIIDLEKINVMPKIEENIIILDIFDGEILDTSVKLNSEIKVVQLKPNKKNRLFN